MTMRRIHGIILSVALATTSAPAIAATPIPTPKTNPTPEDMQRADDLFLNGRALFQDGSYDGAITAFQTAYGLSGDPVLLYNIALAYDRMDAFDEAIEYLEAYRAVAPAEERDALTEKVDSLRRRKLKAQTDAEAAAAKASPSPAPTTTTQPSGPVDDGRPREPARDRVFGPAAITLTVLTVAAAGVGIGLGVASAQRRNSARDQCNSGANGATFCPDTSEGDIDRSRSFAIGADVSFALAGAAGIALIAVVAAKAAKRNKKKRESAVAVSPRANGFALEF
jgi:tetratricopeptide (TPR) repeat protein